jgi:hypothetical protein
MTRKWLPGLLKKGLLLRAIVAKLLIALKKRCLLALGMKFSLKIRW